jgi:hypothetical protein
MDNFYSFSRIEASELWTKGILYKLLMRAYPPLYFLLNFVRVRDTCDTEICVSIVGFL